MADMMNYSGGPTGSSQLGQLPSGYSSQLMTNLAAAGRAQTNANNQQAIDNTSRNPMMGGALQSLLRQNQQQGGDQNLNNATQVQLGAANQANSNNMMIEQQNNQNNQNALNRMLEQQKMDLQMKLQTNQNNFTEQQANIDRMSNMMGTVVGGVMGGV